MKKRRSGPLTVLTALVLTAALLSGCGGSVKKENDSDADGSPSAGSISGVSADSTVSSSSAAEEESCVIGLSIADREPSGRWDAELQVFETCAENENCRLRVLDAGGDAKKQAEQCSALLNSETVDVMIIQPVDPEQAAGIVSSAHDVGVPVIAYEQMIQNSDPDYYVCAAENPEDAEIPRKNLAQAAGVLAGMASRGDYPMTGDMTVEGSWTETAVGRYTIPTFVVTDPAGQDPSE